MFWSETTENHPFEYSWKLKHGKLSNDFYVVVLPAQGSSNLLELLQVKEAMKAEKRGEELVVVGIAAGKEEAMEIAGRIVDTVYQQTGDLKVKDYFDR